MKNYLVSVDPFELHWVVSQIRGKDLLKRNILDSISTVIVTCSEDRLAELRSIRGVQSVEEEGTSYAV